MLVLRGMPFDLVQIIFKTRRFPAVNADMHPSLGGSGLLRSNTHTNTNSLFITQLDALSLSLTTTHTDTNPAVFSHTHSVCTLVSMKNMVALVMPD